MKFFAFFAVPGKLPRTTVANYFRIVFVKPDAASAAPELGIVREHFVCVRTPELLRLAKRHFFTVDFDDEFSGA